MAVAAIENARDYNALMILGRSTGNPVPRRVAVWDHLQVFGQFINNSDVRAKHAIEPLRYGRLLAVYVPLRVDEGSVVDLTLTAIPPPAP